MAYTRPPVPPQSPSPLLHTHLIIYHSKPVISVPFLSRPGLTGRVTPGSARAAALPFPATHVRKDRPPAPWLGLAILPRMRVSRSLDMPKIRPAPKADRQAFGKQLPKGQRPLFDQLARLVE